MTMCVQRAPLAKDEHDPKLEKWLQSKIADALSDDSEPVLPIDLRDEDSDEAPTDPGPPARTAAPDKGPQTAPLTAGWTVPQDEDDEDPETVLGGLPWAEEEDAADPETVQRSQMPVSFIGESVMDDNTVMDGSDAAKHWREETASLRREVLQERAQEAAKSQQETAPRPPPRPPPALTDDPSTVVPQEAEGRSPWLAVGLFVIALAMLVVLVATFGV